MLANGVQHIKPTLPKQPTANFQTKFQLLLQRRLSEAREQTEDMNEGEASFSNSSIDSSGHSSCKRTTSEGSIYSNDRIDHVTVCYRKMRTDDTEWETLNSDYQIKMDQKGNYSVFVPAEDESGRVVRCNKKAASRSTGWYRGMWDALSSTLYECKVGVSYLYPHVQFSMMCQAVIQENPHTDSFGLTVICYRADRGCAQADPRSIVGVSLKPKLVRPGMLQ